MSDDTPSKPDKDKRSGDDRRHTRRRRMFFVPSEWDMEEKRKKRDRRTGKDRRGMRAKPKNRASPDKNEQKMAKREYPEAENKKSSTDSKDSW